MNSFVALALCALACSTNALYHFHFNPPDPCDLIVHQVVTIKQTKIEGIMRLHGLYHHAIMNTTIGGEPPVRSVQILRPDYAERGSAAKVITWTESSCETIDVDSADNILNISRDMVFTNKEPAVFHGIHCTVMYNATDPLDRYYVDEKKGRIYGGSTREMEMTMRYIKAFDNKPEKFVLDRKAHATCDGVAFVPPTRAAYEAACKNTTVNFNAVLRSFFGKP